VPARATFGLNPKPKRERGPEILEDAHVKLPELPLEFYPSHSLDSLDVTVALLSKPRNAGQRYFVWRPSVLGGYLDNTGDRQTAVYVRDRNHQRTADFAVVAKVHCPNFTWRGACLHSS